MEPWRDELYHFGIIGQKWGIRRFQNKDGSLTAAGQKRYSKSEIEDGIDKELNRSSDIVGRIKENGMKLSSEADLLGKKYEQAFNSVSLSKFEKEELKNEMHSFLDTDQFDEDQDEIRELCEDYIRGEIEEIVAEKVNKAIQNDRVQFEKLQERYWNDVGKVRDNILAQYGKAKIADSPYDSSMVINEMLGSKLNTSWNSYISRHFDDYWVYDTDAYNNAVDRLFSQVNE